MPSSGAVSLEIDQQCEACATLIAAGHQICTECSSSSGLPAGIERDGHSNVHFHGAAVHVLFSSASDLQEHKRKVHSSLGRMQGWCGQYGYAIIAVVWILAVGTLCTQMLGEFSSSEDAPVAPDARPLLFLLEVAGGLLFCFVGVPLLGTWLLSQLFSGFRVV